MPLIDSLYKFRSSVAEAQSFVIIAFQQNATGTYILEKFQREFILDSTFLKVFIAWEGFLESCFINYLMGELSINGNVVIRYSQPTSVEHAHKMIIGTQKYFDWADPERVKQLSKLYFVIGNPLDNYISSILSDLKDLKNIRNAAAHLSSTTTAALDAIASRKLRRTVANISVSELMFSLDPTPPATSTIFDTYLSLFDIAAEGIAYG